MDIIINSSSTLQSSWSVFIMKRSRKPRREVVTNQTFFFFPIKTIIEVESITAWIILKPIPLLLISAHLPYESLPLGPSEYLCNLLNLIQPCLPVLSFILQQMLAFFATALPPSDAQKPKTATPTSRKSLFIVIHISFLMLP
jgi:hypothetical protein